MNFLKEIVINQGMGFIFGMITLIVIVFITAIIWAFYDKLNEIRDALVSGDEQ